MRKPMYALITGAVLVTGLAACGSRPSTPAAGAPGKAAAPPASVSPSPSAASGVDAGSGGDVGTGGTGGDVGTGNGKPDRCHTASLRASLHTFQWPGQAGSEGDAELGLTNTGNRPCVIYGYPGLQLIGPEGGARPTTVERDKRRPATPITLAPGRTAWALVTWRFTPLPDEENSSPLCGGKNAGIKVIPPDETTQLTATAAVGTVCQHGLLTTSPMQSAQPSTQPPS